MVVRNRKVWNSQRRVRNCSLMNHSHNQRWLRDFESGDEYQRTSEFVPASFVNVWADLELVPTSITTETGEGIHNRVSLCWRMSALAENEQRKKVPPHREDFSVMWGKT